MRACRVASHARASLTAQRCSSVARQQWRYASGGSHRAGEKSGLRKAVPLLLTAGVGGGLYYLDDSMNGPLKQLLSGESKQEAEPRKPKYQKAEIEFEKARKHSESAEENRDLISSQHVQVKKSWENPGVYAWGSNVGKVIDPNSKENVVKLPRRISYFDGQLLRDIKLTQGFGAAVTEKGDVVQWGLDFSKKDPTPQETLKGKDISKIAVSNDRIIALSSNGSVYSLPASRSDQEVGAKLEPQSQSSSWIPFWSSNGPESVNFRNLTPKSLGRGEKVVDIKSGLQHCLLLTSQGRVFSAAASTSEFPSKGQLGIPGLTWATRPKGPYDQPHEISGLSGFKIAKIAAGDLHSVALDQDGKIFTFGDNTFGQLGFPYDATYQKLDVPSLLPIAKLYANSGLVPKITSVAAGGLNTFFTVDATESGNQNTSGDVSPSRRMPRVTADLWACGQGVLGALGTGKWTHVTPGPVKVKALSSLFEFDEKSNGMAPIRLSNISVGSTHVSATMDNVTRTGAGSKGSESDTNWGADVLFWGGNEHYQLGTGKRNNLNTPSYIGTLDGGASDALMGRGGEMHRFQLTPRQTVRLGEDGKGRKVSLEQRVECGRFVTAVYSGV
ncbi:mitochondrial protein [Colletotrichum truncatum]|uniref:Mitochondrial protein n=1 Tax=Colletotrichum truncatum TaxID=5467 RepID=A0ACC3Z6F5_COLTU|nr:mitochondrial protein [Colletotrichum truncatum]KAF6788047.1 mitochondrial protein [Colletotrichum truncatum]